jgi:glycosyltransferase involved in cell wall biosynthesis
MFCIITPIFDDALRAVNLLIKDLEKQTFKDFVHVLVSNGSSPKIFDNLAHSERVQYIELPHQNTIETFDLVRNLGKRRNYCIKNIVADRYFFFDADLLITENTFLEKVKEAHDKADIIISKVEAYNYILPFGLLQKGQIDIANYSFSRAIAEKYDYPTDCDGDVANDFRFYDKIRNESHYFLNLVFGKKDGRNIYETVSRRHRQDFFLKKDIKKTILFTADVPDYGRNYYSLEVLQKIVETVRLPIPVYHKETKVKEINKWRIEDNKLVVEDMGLLNDFELICKKSGYIDEDEFFHVQDIENVEGVLCGRIY